MIIIIAGIRRRTVRGRSAVQQRHGSTPAAQQDDDQGNDHHQRAHSARPSLSAGTTASAAGYTAADLTGTGFTASVDSAASSCYFFLSAHRPVLIHNLPLFINRKRGRPRPGNPAGYLYLHYTLLTACSA